MIEVPVWLVAVLSIVALLVPVVCVLALAYIGRGLPAYAERLTTVGDDLPPPYAGFSVDTTREASEAEREYFAQGAADEDEARRYRNAAVRVRFGRRGPVTAEMFAGKVSAHNETAAPALGGGRTSVSVGVSGGDAAE